MSIDAATNLLQAVNEAKQNPNKYESLARRFHSIFFLATPHQGFEDPRLIPNIIRAGAPEGRNHHNIEIDPSFVHVAQEINGNFRHSYESIHIHCFYEVPGIRNVIVNMGLATLSFNGESSTPMMTDHFGVSRFPDASDPNYQLLRDALARTVDEIASEFSNPEKIQSQMSMIGDLLDVDDSEDEELANFRIVEQSCNWLLQRESFRQWCDTNDSDSRPLQLSSSTYPRPMTNGLARSRTKDTCRIFWLAGPPGSGKSHLSAHVIKHLEASAYCSYYFLRHTDRSKQSLGMLLRSLAYQMARRDVSLRRTLLSMQQDGSLTAENHDVRTLWKQLFVQKIFKTGFQSPQFWVIDALDEGIGGQDLIKLFDTIPGNLPLRIFISSRHEQPLERDFKGLSISVENIQVEDTMKDIRLFLTEHRDYIHLQPAETDELIDDLQRRSRGSFLWVRLILERLRYVWNSKAIPQIMSQIPDDMNQLYIRVVEEMASKPQNKHLAKAILRWTICARRALTTAELQDAIEKDLDDSIPIIDKMIGDVCGQLVVIEKHDRVTLVHDTARNFLLQPDLHSEFAVDKASAHARVADVLLQYLIDQESLHKSQAGRWLGSSDLAPQTPLHEYAHLYFSEHVLKGPPADDQDSGIMDRVVEFLESRILYTVEYIAREHDLRYLTQIAKNLSAWVSRRADQSLPTADMKLVSGWAVDLIRLVTVFGKHILSDPACIHTIIPPLCPTKSQINRYFGQSSLGMEVVGLSEREWTDRIFTAQFQDDSVMPVACGETTFAVGLRSGIVVVYDAATCQEIQRLNHGKPVKLLEFSSLNEWLLVSGSRMISLWNYNTGEHLWTINISSEPMAIGIWRNDSVIVAATRNNRVMMFAVSNGETVTDNSWHAGGASSQLERSPMKVVFSGELGIFAVIYRYQPLWLIDLSNLARPKYFGGQTTVAAVTFNPALRMMVVAFLDGELCTVQLSTLKKTNTVEVNTEHLILSTDGKTLVAGTKDGRIVIYDFETLTELYTVKFEDEDIMSLSFSPNGLRILDARRKEINLWEPSALYRRKDTESSQGHTSFGTANTQPHQIVSGTTTDTINVIVAHPSGDYVFCGKADGSVCVHDTRNGKLAKRLFDHGPMAVHHVEWNDARECLITCDSSNQVMGHKAKLSRVRTSAGTRNDWQVSRIFKKQVSAPVRQLLSSVDGDYLLVSDPEKDDLWTLKGESIMCYECEQPENYGALSQKWTSYLRHKNRLYGIEPHGIHTLSWSLDTVTTPKIDPVVVVKLNDRIDFVTKDNGVHFIKVRESGKGQIIWAAYDDNLATRPLMWETTTSSDQEDETDATLEYFNQAAPSVQSLLGLYKAQLVFVDHQGWICLMPLERQSQGKLHTRHFPVPHCWRSFNRRIVATVTSKGDVVIARNNEVAVVKRGLISYNLPFRTA